ncbi:cytochrome P450 [Streptomyces sp. NPDC093252]|uniref:cytochrome P450 n=1 Tax=Streptomyces sp. NPDC093252 TaxID=3154980 RepID=UPI00343B17F7
MTTAPAPPPYVSGALPVLGHAAEFMRRPEELLARGRAEHGDLFSLRLPVGRAVVMGGSEHAGFVFGRPEESLSIREAYPFFRHMFTAEAYFLAEHEEYLRQREMVLPRFRSHRMADHLGVMEHEIGAFVAGLPDEGEFDLVEAMGPLVLRIAAGCFLGRDVQAAISGFFALFRDFSGGVDPLLPGWFPAPRLIRSHRARDRLRAGVGRLLDERRREPLPDPDFLQQLAEARYADGSPVPDSIRISLVLMLVWVGYETTTGHLCWALIDLLRHPEERRLVEAERRRVLPDPVVPLTPALLHRMRRLDAAVHESERLHPITNGVVRTAREDLVLGEALIPRGTTVVLHPGLVHSAPGTFPDPGVFRPGRFLSDPAAGRALIGFGGGLHRCLGEHFAYTEIKLILTRLLHHLDLRLIDADPRPVAGQKNKWPRTPCRVGYVRR